MILWLLLDKDTQNKLKKSFPRFKPPKLETSREIVFTPVIRIEDIEETMTQLPRGPLHD